MSKSFWLKVIIRPLGFMLRLGGKVNKPQK
jgi:hypothetical protein